MPKIICFNCRNVITVERVNQNLTKSGKISKAMIKEGMEKLFYANKNAHCCDNPDYRGE